MDFINLKAQQALIRTQIEDNIKRVLDHGKYIMGPEVTQLEELLSEFVGTRHCIGVSSGTDALLVAMMALGIGPGDEVITTPFTFIATGEMIALLGAKPVFVDIDPKTYNIDPSAIEAAMTPKTRAIMPVSLYGQCAEFDVINQLADSHGIPVIEDGAQSFGADYKGRKSCALSSIGCTSFFPSKPLGGYGDSGACFTDDDDLAKAMREIRVHGQDRRYHHPRIGLNARMDTMQAAILLAKMQLFPEEVKSRSAIGKCYTEMILTARDQSGKQTSGIVPPTIESYNTSVYAQYTVLVQNRPKVQDLLKQQGIPTAVHYPVPLHEQPVFNDQNSKFPVATQLSEQVISLPMHPYLKTEEQKTIIDALINAVCSD